MDFITEFERIPYTTESFLGNRVLVMAPHCDDEIIGCGGSLIQHGAHGDSVRVLFFSDDVNPQFARARRKEAGSAMKALGVTDYRFLGLKDRELHYEDIESVLSDTIAEYRPTLIYLPWRGENHPDHRAISEKTCEYFTKNPEPGIALAMYEISAPLQPNCFIDISKQIKKKKTALNFYKTQTRQNNYSETMIALSKYRTFTLSKSVKYAEAYIKLSATRQNIEKLF